MTTAQRNRILRARYPKEGASASLCHDVGLVAWQVRYRARRIGLYVNNGLKMAKQRQWSGGRYAS